MKARQLVDVAAPPAPARRLDPEVVYDALVAHTGRCPSCWPWRNELARVRRLCRMGQVLVTVYADAVLAEAAVGPETAA